MASRTGMPQASKREVKRNTSCPRYSLGSTSWRGGYASQVPLCESRTKRVTQPPHPGGYFKHQTQTVNAKAHFRQQDCLYGGKLGQGANLRGRDMEVDAQARVDEGGASGCGRLRLADPGQPDGQDAVDGCKGLDRDVKALER